MPTVIVQKWEETERGWGSRPDGYSVHVSERVRNLYVDGYWLSMPDAAPHEYSRPCGTPYPCEVTRKEYKALEAQGGSRREYSNTYPVVAAQTGG